MYESCAFRFCSLRTSWRVFYNINSPKSTLGTNDNDPCSGLSDLIPGPGHYSPLLAACRFGVTSLRPICPRNSSIHRKRVTFFAGVTAVSHPNNQIWLQPAAKSDADITPLLGRIPPIPPGIHASCVHSFPTGSCSSLGCFPTSFIIFSVPS